MAETAAEEAVVEAMEGGLQWAEELTEDARELAAKEPKVAFKAVKQVFMSWTPKSLTTSETEAEVAL